MNELTKDQVKHMVALVGAIAQLQNSEGMGENVFKAAKQLHKAISSMDKDDLEYIQNYMAEGARRAHNFDILDAMAASDRPI